MRKIFTCGIGILDFRIRSMSQGIIWDPTNDQSFADKDWNPESTVWNPESKTVINSLRGVNPNPQQLVSCFDTPDFLKYPMVLLA